MNKSKYYLSSVLSVLFLSCVCSSCEDQFPDATPTLKYINVDKHSISFSAQGLYLYEPPCYETIKIAAVGADWIITGKPSWITLDEEKGNGNAAVKISADVYYDTSSSRSATIYLRSVNENDNIAIPINIEQNKANNKILKLSTTRIDLNSNEATEVVNLDSNCEWTWSCNASWVKVQSRRLKTENGLNTDEVTIIVEPNNSNYSRSATINFESAGNSTSLSVYQSWKY